VTAARDTAVGGFVLGGLALGVGFILVFSGMHLFQKKVRASVVFRESVAGLTVGSPVTFRGVQIGQVQEMKVHFNAADHLPVIPVILDLEPGKVIWTEKASADDDWNLQDAVRAGLRAQLTQQSLITGQMSINLDLYPKAAAVALPADDGTPQIPTIPSDAARLKDEILGLNLPDMGVKTRLALASLQHTLDELAANIGPLSKDLRSTLQATRQTLDRYDRLAAATQGQITTNGAALDALLVTTEKTMTQAAAVVASLDEMTSPRSAQRADFDAALRDLAASASSLRELTHDLERHPAATLLR
jgi:paraquat-inducible protein B